MNIKLLMLLLPLFFFTACDSLHKKEDIRVYYDLCIRDADSVYDNRFRSEQARKLHALAIANCQKKFKACEENFAGKACQKFRYRFMIHHP